MGVRKYNVALVHKKSGKKTFKVMRATSEANVIKRIPKRYKVTWVDKRQTE